MSVVIHCSHCRRMLRLDEAYLGQTVQCPSCGAAFATQRDEGITQPPAVVPDFELSSDRPSLPPREPAEPPTTVHQQRRPLQTGKQTEETYAVQLDAEALEPKSGDRNRRARRSRPSPYEEEADDVQPHRGVLILILGILSIVVACIPLAGWILGGISMSMASHDERLMENRAMDRSGHAMTKAGHACGIIGVFLATIMFIINVAIAVSMRR